MKQTDKNIKEIRIYHSLWKNILLTVGCFAFAAGGYFILHDANTSWPTKVFGGIGSMVFFGCGGMLMFMMTLYNITTHIPFLIIHDDRLDIYEQRKRTYRTIYFSWFTIRWPPPGMARSSDLMAATRRTSPPARTASRESRLCSRPIRRPAIRSAAGW